MFPMRPRYMSLMDYISDPPQGMRLSAYAHIKPDQKIEVIIFLREKEKVG